MAVFYVDYNTGDDNTGTGTALSPFKTVEKARVACGGSGQHTIYMKAGTVEPLTTNGGIRNGLGPTKRSVLTRWGDGPNPQFIATAQMSSGMHWILDGGGYKDYIGIDFNCNFLASVGFELYAGTTGITDCSFTSCSFFNTRLVNNASAFYVHTDTNNPSITGIVTKNCKFYNASQHGAHAVGNVSITHINGEAYNNGIFDTAGGHGFSSYRGASTTVTSGWSLQSGTVYSRTLGNVGVVYRSSGAVLGLKQNILTPTSPSSGEWGQVGTTLYVNIGENPSGVSITIATYCPTVTYDGCSAHHNRILPSGLEGTGIHADEFTGNITILRCKTMDNEGAGVMLNQPGKATIRGLLSLRNGKAGISVNSLGDGNFDFITCAQNNRRGINGDISEFQLQLGCQNISSRNSVYDASNENPVVTRAVSFDSTTGSGNTLTDVVAYGKPIVVDAGTVTQTRVTTGNPGLLPNGDIAAQTSFVYHSGQHIGYFRNKWNPPSIGALEYMKQRAERN